MHLIPSASPFSPPWGTRRSTARSPSKISCSSWSHSCANAVCWVAAKLSSACVGAGADAADAAFHIMLPSTSACKVLQSPCSSQSCAQSRLHYLLLVKLVRQDCTLTNCKNRSCARILNASRVHTASATSHLLVVVYCSHHCLYLRRGGLQVLKAPDGKSDRS